MDIVAQEHRIVLGSVHALQCFHCVERDIKHARIRQMLIGFFFEFIRMSLRTRNILDPQNAQVPTPSHAMPRREHYPMTKISSA
jgi:hypothetical protein